MTSTALPQRLWETYQPGVQSSAPGIVAGVPIIGSMVNFAAAAFDVFLMAVRGYQGDEGYGPGPWRKHATWAGLAADGTDDGGRVGQRTPALGRIVQGFRSGLSSFARTTAVETINISFKIVMGTHVRRLRPAVEDAGWLQAHSR